MRLLSALVALGLVGCSGSEDSASSQSEIVVERCPEKLTVELSGFGASSNEDAARLEALPSFATNLVIANRSNGVCSYATEGDADRKVTTTFSTDGDAHVLAVGGTSPETTGLTFAITLAAYARDSVTAAEPGATILEGGARIGVAGTAIVTAGEGMAPIGDEDLVARLEETLADVTYASEIESTFDVFTAPLATGEKLDAETLTTKLSGKPGTSVNGRPLAGQPGTEPLDYSAWMASATRIDPSASVSGQQLALAMQRVDELLRAQCSDLQVLLVSGIDVPVQLFIAGRTANQRLVAVHTTAQWM